MKKWSTSWTPLNIVSPQQHPGIVEKTSPYLLRTEAIEEEPVTEPAFENFIKPPPEPEVIFQGHTTEELEQARKEAHQAGYQKGQQEGTEAGKGERYQLDQTISASLASLDTQLEAIVKAYHQHVDTSRNELTRLAYEVAEKIAGEALEANAVRNIEHLITESLGFILHEPDIVIYVHPHHESRVKEHIQHYISDEKTRSHITIHADERCAETDCRIEWEQGGASLSIVERWQKIRNLLQDDMANIPTELLDKKGDNSQDKTNSPEEESD